MAKRTAKANAAIKSDPDRLRALWARAEAAVGEVRIPQDLSAEEQNTYRYALADALHRSSYRIRDDSEMTVDIRDLVLPERLRGEFATHPAEHIAQLIQCLGLAGKRFRKLAKVIKRINPDGDEEDYWEGRMRHARARTYAERALRISKEAEEVFEPALELAKKIRRDEEAKLAAQEGA